MPVDSLSQCAQRLAPFILLIYMVFICVELAADNFFKTKAYNFDDTLHNLIMFFVNRMTGGLGGAFMFSVLSTMEPGHLLYGIKGVGVENNLFVAQLKPFVSFAARRHKLGQREFRQ